MNKIWPGCQKTGLLGLFVAKYGSNQPNEHHLARIMNFQCGSFSYYTSGLYQNINFLISQPKHMLWVIKRTVSMSSFEHKIFHALLN